MSTIKNVIYGENDFRSYELYHHGILGMKWGQRQGPPYPLSNSNHSTSEKESNYKKSIGMKKGSRNESQYAEVKKTLPSDEKERKDKVQKASAKGKDFLDKAKDKWNNMSPEDKETIKKVAIGAAVIGGTALAGYMSVKYLKATNDKYTSVDRKAAATILKDLIESGEYGKEFSVANAFTESLYKESGKAREKIAEADYKARVLKSVITGKEISNDGIRTNNKAELLRLGYGVATDKEKARDLLKEQFGEKAANDLMDKYETAHRKSIKYNTSLADEMKRVLNDIPDAREAEEQFRNLKLKSQKRSGINLRAVANPRLKVSEVDSYLQNLGDEDLISSLLKKNAKALGI